MTPTTGDVDLAGPASLMAEPARAAMLLALLGGRALPASQLAQVAGVSASTASEHLARLREGGLVEANRSGRHRYFALRGPDVSAAIEALALLAPRRPVHSLRAARTGRAIGYARTCYDHLAGQVGVAVTDALTARGVVAPVRPGEVGRILAPRHEVLATIGFDPDPRSRRPAVRGCLDWTQRRPHLAGGLGARLLSYADERGWVERARTDRSVRVTDAGRTGLTELLQLDAGALEPAA